MQRKMRRQRQRNIQKEMKRWQCAVTKMILPPLAAAGLLLGVSAYSLGNPTDGTVTAGTGTIGSSGSTTTITQTSDKLAINWQSFNIGSGERVNFVQPGTNAIALNRVIGSNPSAIYGTLTANGKVFLINPNGILFSSTAQVNVGGLVASTLNLSDSDFLSGNYIFNGSGGNGAVINQGTIHAVDGGYVALLGSQAINEGVIVARQGTVALGAGNQITLDFDGDSLINLAVDQASFGALVENKNLIKADGGTVLMTAKAADALAGTVVNNSGFIEAQSIASVNGEIILDGGTSGAVTNSGALDASGKNAAETGGTVKVLGNTVSLNDGSRVDVSGDKGGGITLIGGNYQGSGTEQHATATTVAAGATINADALTSGNGGKVVVWADGATRFAGTITARGGNLSGDGGSVETSGHNLAVADTVKVNTTAANGKTGNWLLDPTEYTIDSSNVGTITGNLATTNYQITTSAGDITVSTPVSWSSANTLTLTSAANININANITAGDSGNLTLTAGGTISVPAAVSIGGVFTLTKGAWNQIAASLPSFYATDFRIGGDMSGSAFIRALGGDGTSGSPYQIADVYGLQGIGSSSSGMLGNNYVLANNINAGGTTSWNGGAGFIPIGRDIGKSFTGSFNGQGHTITGLYINNSILDTGLFGSSTGAIRNVGLINCTVRYNVGGSYASRVGALVGFNNGSIVNSYSTGTVSGSGSIGGLVGVNGEYYPASITNCYSTCAVTGPGSGMVGGLVGQITYAAGPVTITNCYSTGTVSGGYNAIIGGMVGYISVGDGMAITNCYSTGAVTGDWSYAGGPLVGEIASNKATITNCYSAGAVRWVNNPYQTDYAGGLVGHIDHTAIITNSYCLTTDQMKQSASFSGWDIATTGGSSVWRIYEGYSYPLLRSLLTPLTVTVSSPGTTYNGSAYSGATASYSATPNSTLFGTLTYTYDGATTAPTNAGSYTVAASGQYSIDNFGYDINYVNSSLTINPRAITVTPETGQSKIYGEADPILDYTVGGSDLVPGDTLNGSLAYSGTNVGNHTLTQGTLTNMNNPNYAITYSNPTAITFAINKRPITVTANYQFKSYGEADPTTLTYSVAGGTGTSGSALVGSDVLSGALTRDSGSNAGFYAISQGTLKAIDGNSGNNYDITCVGNFQIIKRWIIVTPTTGQSKIYGEADPTLTYSVDRGMGLTGSALVGSDTLSGSLSYYPSTGKNVGSYPITQGTLTNGNNANYNIQYNNPDYTINFTINRRPITVTPLTGQSKIYGEANPTLTYSVAGGTGTSGSALVGSDTLSGSLTYSGTNVGSYTLTQGTLNNPNYTITYSNPTAIAFTINKRPITVTPTTGQSKIYGEADPTLTYSVVGGTGTSGSAVVNGDTLSGSLTYTGTNVGSYTLAQGTLTNANNANYDITYNSANFTINRRPITVTPTTGQSKIYGEADPTLAYSVAGGTGTSGSALVGSDTLSGSLIYTGTNVGSYTLTQGTLTNANNANYDITYNSANFTINRRPIMITANSGQSKIYGEADPTLTYSVAGGTGTSGSALVGSDTLSGSLNYAGTNVGSYTLTQGTLTNENNANYAITYNSANFTIHPRPITVTPTTGQSKIYGETDPTLAYSVAGGTGTSGSALVGSDTLNGSLTYSGTNVGSYTLTQGTLISANNTNYDITYSNPTAIKFTINKRPITVTADSGQSKIYGEADPTLTYSVAGGTGTSGSAVVNGDTLNGSLTYTGTNVGSYTINQGTLTNVNNPNYTITYNNPTAITFAITPRDLTVTANNATKWSGMPNPAFDAIYTGFVGGDTATSLNGTLTFSTTATIASPAGQYAIAPFGVSSANYSIAFINGILTVRPSDPINSAIIDADHTTQSHNPGQSSGWTGDSPSNGGATDNLVFITGNGGSQGTPGSNGQTDDSGQTNQ